MYETALVVHSVLRWVVLFVALWAFWRALTGWLGSRARGSLDRTAGWLLTFVIDAQFLLGLLLWVVWSPQVQQARKDFGAAMKDSELRYWAVEHGTLMIAALAFVHVGKVLVKKARGDQAAHRRGALFYGLALAAMLVATPWPFGAHPRPWLRLGG